MDACADRDSCVEKHALLAPGTPKRACFRPSWQRGGCYGRMRCDDVLERRLACTPPSLAAGGNVLTKPRSRPLRQIGLAEVDEYLGGVLDFVGEVGVVWWWWRCPTAFCACGDPPPPACRSTATASRARQCGTVLPCSSAATLSRAFSGGGTCCCVCAQQSVKNTPPWPGCRAFLQFDLRNGALRKKFDGLKYALKRIEQTQYELSLADAGVAASNQEPEPQAPAAAEGEGA